MAHVWSGGGDISKEGVGHMSFLELSAFDPIFWLHHNFIDMILAIWQTETKNKLVLLSHYEFSSLTLSSFWFDNLEPGDPNATDPLLQFYTADEQPFTNDIKDWTVFNYTYDILAPKPSQMKPDGSLDEEKHLADLAAEINKRYSTSCSEVLSARSMRAEAAPQSPHYIINVTYDNRHALKELYSIHLFAGPLDLAYDSDRAQPNRLGTVFTFSRFNPAETCASCKGQINQGDLSTGQIPIMGAMTKDVEDPFVADADGMDPDRIGRYLERFLVWKIVTLTGREVQPGDVPGLKITVFAGRAEHSHATDHLSAYSNYKPVFRATAGKPGGASEELGAY
ncbi:hypothetical protein JX266_000578 [Neoarthrinium moseri]|nr:hypothetical protein JX266_000578 [Neoarthrinium moseri]